MKLIRVLAAIALLGWIGAGTAHAVEVKPGGLIFADYGFVASQNLQNGTTSQGFSSFDVSRIYLNAEAKYDEKVTGFLQLEANLSSRDGKNNRVYVKNAELRIKFSDAAKLCGGLIGVPWRALEESVWKQRFVSKDLEDLEAIGNATDRGIRLGGKVPFAAYDLMISNGEGTGGDGNAGNENTAFNGGGRLKDFSATLSVIPFERVNSLWKGLKANLLALKGDKSETQVRNRIFAGLSYESALFNLMWTYYNADNSGSASPSRGEGYSLHTVVMPKEYLWIFARFDHYNPNINAGGFSHNRTIYGLGFQITKGVRVSLDHQYMEQETRTNALQDESIVFVHTEVKF